MGDLKSRIRTRIFRRSSAISTPSSTKPAHNHLDTPPPSPPRQSAPSSKSRNSGSSQSLERSRELHTSPAPDRRREARNPYSSKNEDYSIHPDTPGESLMSADQQAPDSSTASNPPAHGGSAGATNAPELVLQEPTPETKTLTRNPLDIVAPPPPSTDEDAANPTIERRKQLVSDTKLPGRESARKPSLIAISDVEGTRALLSDDASAVSLSNPQALARPTLPAAADATNPRMLHRKIWVKRPAGAATIVIVKEDDMVDEAKDAILQKFRNSLGKHFDAPDVTIRILSRDGPGERILSPDETICRAIDSNYPGGQTIADALIIDVPQKNKTPRPSPRAAPYAYYFSEETRPHESGTDYFPLMPPAATSPAMTTVSHESRHSHAAHERAMSVLNTGQVPPLPSPGGGRRAHHARQGRPAYARQPTSSPTALTSSVSSRQARPRLDSTASIEKQPAPPQAPPLPTPPAPDAAKAPSNPGSPRVSSPRPSNRRKTKQKAANAEPTPVLPPGTIDTAVPPINVLIVEDNHINMKLLEQFVRRLKVRWDTAVNGREAVNKWRKGGFHLVLMDIQLPIMSGLEATKEIRRLERINNIGAFSNTPSEAGGAGELLDGDMPVAKEEDRLSDAERLFKSPVIIVALTASNLQSDRHEALAAGCNDFLTKPVNFVWFERKVKEWGCMQALIDFDGWRKWKDFATANGLKDASSTPQGLALPKKPAPPSQNALNLPSPTTTPQKRPSNASVGSSSSSNEGGTKAPAGIDGRVLTDGEPDGGVKSPAKMPMLESRALVKEDSPDTVVGVETKW